MTLRNHRRLLLALSLMVLLFGFAVLHWGLSSKTDLDLDFPAQTNVRSSSVSSRPDPKPASLTAKDFESLWQKPLRKPLYDPPPPPPKIVEKPPPRPIVARLLATMIEPGNSMAMLRLASGEVVFRKQGEMIGGEDRDVKVGTIEAGQIRVIRGTDETKLVVPGRGGD